MPSSNLIDYGDVPMEVLAPLIRETQALSKARWVHRGDPESYETTAIRKDLPSQTQEVLGWIADHLLKPGFFNRVVLSCVPAGKKILPHTDNFGEPVKSQSIHCHLPLVTDPTIVLGFERGHHLEVGHVYRMDESQRHWVDNPSACDRIHLLFAFWPHDGNILDLLTKGVAYA